MDVVIVGGGVIGLALARELAGFGARAIVLERGRAGGGATRAAAGILSPTDPHEWVGELGAFNAAALAAWEPFADALAAEAGLPSGYERRGELRVGAASDPFLQATVAGAAAFGWTCERLAPQRLRALEPGIADGLDALHLPDPAGVNTDQLTAALRAACARRGVAVHDGGEVTALEPGAVRTADGTAWPCATVVVATGAGGAPWLPAPLRPRLRPVLGESLIVRSPEGALCAHPIRSSRGSIVPRADGTYWVGTTRLEHGFASAPSVGSVRTIAGNAASILPALDRAQFVEARSGVRPVSADGRPQLGPVADGVVLATGHGREGIIQAPLTAQLMARAIAEGDWSAVPFAPRS